MPDFGNLEHEAEQLAGEHSDVADKGIEEKHGITARRWSARKL